MSLSLYGTFLSYATKVIEHDLYHIYSGSFFKHHQIVNCCSDRKVNINYNVLCSSLLARCDNHLNKKTTSLAVGGFNEERRTGQDIVLATKLEKRRPSTVGYSGEHIVDHRNL